MPPTDAAPTPQLRVLGPVELGVLMAFLLLGLTSSQTYTYYSRFPNDTRKLKTFVALLWAFEVAHVVAVGHYLFETTVIQFSHPEIGLVNVPTSMLVSFFVNGIITCMIEVFFGLRIYRVSNGRYKLVAIVIWVLAVAQLVIPLVPVFTGSSETIPLVAFLTEQTWAVYSAMALSALCDLLIVVGLVYFLWNERDHAHKRTVVIVDKLIAWTVETGLVTGTAATLELILFAVNAFDWRWLAVDCVLAGLYTNTLLANLNSRATLRALSSSINTDTETPMPLSELRMRSVTPTFHPHLPSPNITWEDTTPADGGGFEQPSADPETQSKPRKLPSFREED